MAYFDYGYFSYKKSKKDTVKKKRKNFEKKSANRSQNPLRRRVLGTSIPKGFIFNQKKILY